jgi:hypothetical protein
MYWDCQYNLLEECVPNVLSGNQGFCNVNPAFGCMQRSRLNTESIASGTRPIIKMRASVAAARF